MSERVAIAMPSRGNINHAPFLAMIEAGLRHGAGTFSLCPGVPRDHNRNRIAAAFLAKAYADWLWWVDDDTIVPPDALGKLLSAHRSIVCGVQPLWLADVLVQNVSGTCPADGEVTDWPSWFAHDPKREPFRVGACGFGCVLVHRSVLADIGDPWFREKYGDYEGRGAQTEDIWFCRRAAECGYEIWCHPGVECGHLKLVDLRAVVPRPMVTVET